MRRARSTASAGTRRLRPSRAAVYALLVAGALATLCPLVLLYTGALQSTAEINRGESILPGTLRWSNFADVWTDGRFYQYVGNSVLYSAVVVPVSVLLAAMAAYGFARHRFPARLFALGVTLAMLMVPASAIFLPLYSTLLDLGLTNTRIGYVAAMTASTLPLSVFILIRFFRAIPVEVEEAAVIDGASKWRIFTRVMLPLARPGLAASAVLNLVHVWNEFTLALVVFRDAELMPVQQGLVQFANAERPQQNLMLAAAALALVPVLVVYLVAQRSIDRGITEGATVG
ncbi:carbohydrate ABC transporter permease [Georgenia alba]|uniref:Carbohydrate ABC transporter permease n=1 Tax=Georgenia alba TaxID=2233858 RepID=A0ABW2Q5F7_9MICO